MGKSLYLMSEPLRTHQNVQHHNNSCSNCKQGKQVDDFTLWTAFPKMSE
uniref:Alternative protein PSG7 n=1 Tax=Homo sapiens TaxID=9606 RepID=L8E7R9_HUMAN|nr:alternative protein PSG7 [Homo sapiens]